MFNGFLMPYSGYIKSFVLKDFGLKFLPPPPEELTLGFIEDVIGINVPLPLFTLVLITDTNIIDLGTLNILFGRGDLKPYYSFTSNLPSELKDYKINVKNILNIRSEITTSFPETRRGADALIIGRHFYMDYIHSNPESNYVDEPFKYYGINEDDAYLTYFATILIELDPFE